MELIDRTIAIQYYKFKNVYSESTDLTFGNVPYLLSWNVNKVHYAIVTHYSEPIVLAVECNGLELVIYFNFGQ